VACTLRSVVIGANGDGVLQDEACQSLAHWPRLSARLALIILDVKGAAEGVQARILECNVETRQAHSSLELGVDKLKHVVDPGREVCRLCNPVKDLQLIGPLMLRFEQRCLLECGRCRTGQAL